MRNLKRTLLLLSLATMLAFSLMPFGIVKAQQPLFKVTVIAPGNANLVRRQWGQIFVNSLQQLGIDARLVFLGWGPVYDRVLTPPLANVGKVYDDGGYDIQLIGWTPGLFPEPRQLYYGGDPSFFAPAGQNYYLWNNTDSNNLLDTFITSTNKAAQNSSLQKWQEVYFNEVPSSQIMYQSTHAVNDPDLAGYDWIYFNVQPSPEWLSFTANAQTSVVYASTGELLALIPALSNSWYDTIVWNPIYNGLEQVNNLRQNIPALLVSKNVSADGFRWTYNLRPGVKWHDLFDFSADDVLFSYWALMNAPTGSQFVGYFQSVFGNRVQFTWQNGTSTWLNATTTPARVGHITATNPVRVDFTLPVLALGKPFGYFDPYLLAFANNIIPKHIFEKIPLAQWATSVFNTGVPPTSGPVSLPGITNVTYKGPIGTGPYKWVEFNAAAQVVHLEKFTQYWNASALEAKGQFGVTDYFIRYIADKTSALAALKNDEVDMLDPNYQVQTEVITPGAIDPSWGTVFLLLGAGRQEVGYNMRHPIFGTGTATPLGTATPSRAAEAARYVRQAFDYAVPRQLIIDNLLSGFGQLGATPMLPTQPYYNSTITPRSYDLTQAKSLLQKAGYAVPGAPTPGAIPSFILGFSSPISGTYKPSYLNGNPAPNHLLLLMDTPANATYNSTSVQVSSTTTDLSGFYSFTATPTTIGTHYYYLFDSQAPAGAEWTFAKFLNVTTLSDQLTPLSNQINGLQASVNTLTIVAVAAIVVAVVIGIINFYLMRRRPK